MEYRAGSAWRPVARFLVAPLGLGPEVGIVLECLEKDLPACFALCTLRARIALSIRIPPGTEETMFTDRIKVIHGCRHQDLACHFVHLLTFEQPEPQLPQARRT